MTAAHRNCSIAIGESWFHRATLTPVVVEELFAIGDDEPERINFVGPDGMHGGCEVEDFVRDYARDEPVTLELLERLGWARTFHREAVRHFEEYWLLRAIDQDRGKITISVECNLPNLVGGVHARIKPVHTLRELLVVLRVFGVAESFNNF